MIDSISTKAFLLLAIVAQLIQRILYFSIGEDISIQLHATANFAKGKGIVIDEVLANDLGNPVSSLLSDWPVGYSLLLAPIYKVVANMMWSAMLIDGIFLTLFIFLIYKLLLQSEVEEKAIKLALLFLTISATPFIHTSRTGVLAICFLLMGIIMLLNIAQKEKIGWGSLVFCGIIFTIPILFRYSYLPFVVVPGLFFAAKWILSKEVKFVQYAFLSLAVTTVMVFAINYFQSVLIGERTYLANSNSFGFHFSNLIYFKEFLFKGLFYVEPIIDLGNENFVIKLIFKILGLLLSTLMLISLLVTTLKNSLLKTGNFGIIATIIIGLNIALLVFLSLKYSNFHLTTYSWTFVQETRYFLPAIILLIIYMFQRYHENWIQKILYLAIGYASILLVVGSIQLFTNSSDKLYTNHHKDLWIIKEQLSTLKGPLAFSTQTNEIALRNLIAVEGYPILNSSLIENLEKNNLNSNSPLTLITKFEKEDYLENEVLLKNKGGQKLFENEQFILVKIQFPFG